MPGGSKKGGGLTTKKSAFYLKSGNNTPFKMMGSSPLKQGEGFGHLQDGAMRARYSGGTSVSFRWPWQKKAKKIRKITSTLKVATKKPSKTKTKTTTTEENQSGISWRNKGSAKDTLIYDDE